MGSNCCKDTKKIENSEKLVDELDEELPKEQIMKMREEINRPVI